MTVAPGGNRLEQRAPTTETTPPILAIGNDLTMMIVLKAADVFNSIEHANNVLGSKFFGEDAYGAIEHLCMALQALNNWCQVSKQACDDQTALLTTTAYSIKAKLRQFINRVSYWHIENPNGITDVEMSKKIAYMCDHLNELYVNNPRPPMLSRQREFLVV